MIMEACRHLVPYKVARCTNKKRFLLVFIIWTLFLVYHSREYLFIPGQQQRESERNCTTYNSTRHTLSLSEVVSIDIGNPLNYIETAGYNNALTVVTGYIAVGKYEKGRKGVYRSINDYVEWAEPFQYLLNPVLVYTDSDVFENLILKLRNNSKMFTKIIKIDRNMLWPFTLRPQIEKLFNDSEYPKFYPGTTYPDYTCATNSKFTILVDGMKRFNSSYYCWMDAGYLKYLRGKNKTFTLDVLKNFDKSKISVSKVYDVSMDVKVENVFYKQRNWIAGGMFLGIPEKIKKFEKQYHETVLRYLSENLMAPEQQILYAMYSIEERTKHPVDVDLQTYIPGSLPVPHKSPFHFLGYAMYNER